LQTRSEGDCFFFDIDVKGGEKITFEKAEAESSGEGEESSRRRVVSGVELSPKGIWVLVLPSMLKGEIVGKYCTNNECVLATDSESANGCH
jgi:hypothetical protein